MGCVIGSLASCVACSAASCCLSATCSLCGKTMACKKSTATRGLFAFQFILVSLIAYIMSNSSRIAEWLQRIPVISQCANDGTCVGALAVYRISFGLAAFHMFLAILMLGVKNSSDFRAQFQDAWWPVKFLVLLGITIGAFFIPNSFFVVYEWISVVGAGLFIVIQLVLLIEFAYKWNESWLLKMEDEEMDGKSKWYYLLLTCTLGMIFGSIALTGVMYKFFSSEHGCGFNSAIITVNLIAAVIYCALSLHPAVREGRPSSGLLQSSVVMFYTTYLVWSAMMSEPNTDNMHCNPLTWNASTKGVSLVLGALFTIVSVVYSTVRTASSLGSEEAQPDVEKTPLVTTDNNAAAGAEDDDDARVAPKMEDDEADETAYNHSHFHLSFALGAMYIGMLLTNWMTISEGENVYVDRGMASVWVKVVSGWITVLLYVWTLVAPVLLPGRDWN